MASTLDDALVEAIGVEVRHDNAFMPVARYHRIMDMLIYVNEDCSYVADRVDEYLTLLWNPTSEYVVGIKCKGFRYVFNKHKARLGLDEHHFLPLMKILEVLFTETLGERIIDQGAKQEREHKYQLARTLAKAAGTAVESGPVMTALKAA